MIHAVGCLLEFFKKQSTILFTHLFKFHQCLPPTFLYPLPPPPQVHFNKAGKQTDL